MNWKTTGAAAVLLFELNSAQAAPADYAGSMLADRASRNAYARPYSQWGYTRPHAGNWDRRGGWDIDVYVGPRTPLYYQHGYGPYYVYPKDSGMEKELRGQRKQLERELKDSERRLEKSEKALQRMKDRQHEENVRKLQEQIRQLEAEKKNLENGYVSQQRSYDRKLSEAEMLTEDEVVDIVYKNLQDSGLFGRLERDVNVSAVEKRGGKYVTIGTADIYGRHNSEKYVVFELREYDSMRRIVKGTGAEDKTIFIKLPEVRSENADKELSQWLKGELGRNGLLETIKLE